MKDAKRERIKQAAAECLARFGYEKTTMDDIARRVGLNKTSLYYYFESKEAIFTEVVVQEAQRFIRALQTKIESVSGCRRRILTYLTERLHYYRQVVNLHHLSLDTINRVQPAFKALYQSVLEREIAFIEQILERGFKPGKSATATRAAKWSVWPSSGRPPRSDLSSKGPVAWGCPPRRSRLASPAKRTGTDPISSFTF